MDSPWSEMYKLDSYTRDRVMKSARLLLPYLKEGDTVLDVGCFTQEARKYLPSTINYVGVDEMFYHPSNVIRDLNYPFSIPYSINHALCLETLEHLVDPQKCLDSILCTLEKSGFFVLSLPNEATLFHRLRCLLGTVDANCFVGVGKHLHLPSLKQARRFLEYSCEILKEEYYISPSACNSQQEWLGQILKFVPDIIQQALADFCPSIFSRGFIFLLKPKM